MFLGWPVVPAPSDPQCGSASVPARPALRSVRPAGAVRVSVLAATALLLAGCSIGVNCKPCAPPVQITIIGVRPDPARVLQVCVDGGGSCDQLRIAPASDPSTKPGDEETYPCTVSDPHTGCSVEGDTAYVDFHRLTSKEMDGRRVEVTVTGGQAADEHATAVFQYRPAQGACACDRSHGQVRLAATS